MTKVQQLSSTTLVLELPEGYDECTRITSYQGKVIVVHPNFPPCYIEDGKLVEIVL